MEQLQKGLDDLEEKYPDWSGTTARIREDIDNKKFTEAELKLNDLKADADSMPPVIKAIDLSKKVFEVLGYLTAYKHAYANKK